MSGGIVASRPQQRGIYRGSQELNGVACYFAVTSEGKCTVPYIARPAHGEDDSDVIAMLADYLKRVDPARHLRIIR